jgi:hypothetical protein
MTYHSNFEVACGKPVDVIPQFCEECPIKTLRAYNPGKFLAVLQGMESFGPFLTDSGVRVQDYAEREAARSIIQEDGDFKDRRVAELAILALERQLDGRCIESKGE